MSIVTESVVPQLILQVNAVQRQIYYRGIYKDVPEEYWRDEIGPKLYPLWDTDKDKLIFFSWYDTNTCHVQRRKFIKNFSTGEYEWKDYEMEIPDNNPNTELYQLFKDTFYLVDSLEKESYKDQLAQAYYDVSGITWYSIRLVRNFLLTDSDWAMLSDAPLDEDEKQLWVTYRKALRNLPQDSPSEDPKEVKFPISPADWQVFYKPEVPDEEYLGSEKQYLKLSGYYLGNFKERIIQQLLVKQSAMNPMNYKNYRDHMTQLSSYKVPEINQVLINKIVSGEYTKEEVEANPLDYLIEVAEETVNSEKSVIDNIIDENGGES